MSPDHHPLCDRCWDKSGALSPPWRELKPTLERCCECGKGTRSGIYVRRDPSTVHFPTEGE